MRVSIKRAAAATVAGATASVLLATPAFALKPKAYYDDGYIHVSIYNDLGTVRPSYVAVTNWGPELSHVRVCDVHDDGFTTTLRVDVGDGVGRNVITVKNTCKTDAIPIRKFRLLWGNYATGWYPAP